MRGVPSWLNTYERQLTNALRTNSLLRDILLCPPWRALYVHTASTVNIARLVSIRHACTRMPLLPCCALLRCTRRSWPPAAGAARIALALPACCCRSWCACLAFNVYNSSSTVFQLCCFLFFARFLSVGFSFELLEEYSGDGGAERGSVSSKSPLVALRPSLAKELVGWFEGRVGAL
jgi:hypothetical protein